MKKIGIIIQARTNSLRLKGKIFKKLDDKTLIEWVIKRVKKSKADLVILATSKKKEDKKLKIICERENIEFFTGNEKNVLERFYKTAANFKLDAIIRVCADNPFIDFQEINLLIEAYKKNTICSDYYFNHRNFKDTTYADGFGAELLTYETLKKIYKKTNSSYDKEHVTSYIWKNLDNFKIKTCKTKINKKYHHTILDINKIHDYKKIKRFIYTNKIKVTDSANKIAALYSLHEIECYLNDLFFFNRSLAGEENRKTLNYIKKNIPLKIKSFKSGSKVFGWSVPKEWKLKKGYIADHFGKKIIDFKNNNLHVASYSQPIKKKLTISELEKKIFTHKIYEAIPYRTLYYKKDWAFCASKQDLKKLKKISKDNKGKKFNICIDSSFKNGKMNYGEILIPGKSSKEILISTYICHPSMANDNLSGIILTSLLTNYIKNLNNLKWSYRIIFVPETIGSINYIKKNKNKFKKIDFGINVSCVGGKGRFSFKETWNSNHFLNELVEDIFIKKKIKYKKYKFDIHGSDERQYSYTGSSINTISIHKDKFYEYKEYHSSLDNLSFVKDHQIFESFLIYKELINKIEKQKIYKSFYEYSEPMLSKFELYPDIGGSMKPNYKKLNNNLDNILWILFMSDGKITLSEIKKKLKLKEENLFYLVKQLIEKKLIYHV